MSWDRVVRSIKGDVMGDPILQSIYGESILYGGVKDHRVPLLTFTVIADSFDEQFQPVIVQFDQYCQTLDALATSDRQLRRMFHFEVPEHIGGIFMFAEFEDGADLSAPDRDGFAARAARFRFTPLRELYDPHSTP